VSTPALELAREYLARDYRVVPVPAGQKGPVIRGWEELRLSESDLPTHFSNGNNIGILLGATSAGLVDLDLDCPQAVTLAPRFFPKTTMRWGHENRPDSHWGYRATGTIPATIRLQFKRETLLELRSTGGQTLVPPSTHPDGDEYVWNGSLDPTSIDGDDLVRRVHRLGAACLLTQHWPAPPEPGKHGCRHDVANALAGMLVRGGWPDEHVEKFVSIVAEAAGDEEAKSRAKAALATAKKIEMGGKATGGPALVKLLGADVVEHVRDWLGIRTHVETVESEEHLTELGLADRIVREHGSNMRFVWGWNSWIAWDGKRWMPQAEGDIWQMAKATVRPLLSEASKLPEGDARKAAVRFAMIAERDRTMRSALSLARSEDVIAIKPELLNQDTYLLNTPTGIVDLRSGTVRSHDPGALLTKLCPTVYDMDALAPTWERFLLRVFDQDFGIIGFVQRLMGYAATGSCRENLLPILHGTGANGKSTLTTAIMDVLGQDYAGPIAHSLLFQESKDSHPTAVADLYGKRVAVTHELDSGTRLAEGLVKALTGGDRIKARRMREDLWEFIPTHTLFLATNTKPVVRGTDEGIWRRLKLIPFNVQIPEAERDTELGDKLRAEAPGILGWIVAGARDWHEHGLDTPAAVQSATAAYRSSSDVIGQFVAECCVVNPTIETTAKNLYEKYETWHKNQIGGKPLSQTTFGRCLGERGFVRLSTERPIAWSGIGVAVEATE
jgi:putative DNA primase/helicase